MTADTNATTEILRTLHRIHRQLGDLRAQLARGPRVAAARQANVERLEEQSKAVQDEFQQTRMAADEKQVQLKASEEKIKKYQQQRNEAKSNVEFQGLGDQIAATEMTNSVLEDEILEAMENVDRFKVKVEEAEAEMGKVRGEAEKTALEIQEREPLIRGDVERLESELKQAEDALPADFQEIYRRLVRSKGGDALTPLEGEYCGGCNQKVPINMCSNVMLSKPVFCKSCGRLLYLQERK